MFEKNLKILWIFIICIKFINCTKSVGWVDPNYMTGEEQFWVNKKLDDWSYYVVLFPWALLCLLECVFYIPYIWAFLIWAPADYLRKKSYLVKDSEVYSNQPDLIGLNKLTETIYKTMNKFDEYNGKFKNYTMDNFGLGNSTDNSNSTGRLTFKNVEKYFINLYKLL